MHLGGRERDRGRTSLLCTVPIFFDMQVPLPRQMVCLVVICEVGFDVVASPNDHALWSLLHRGEKLVLLSSRTVAAHHVHCLIHYR